jgi:hypothetical protein
MKRTLALTVLVVLLASLALPSVVMFADGTETLGDPSIPIAMGSGFVASGVGLGVQPGTITIDVPAGATVNQVLLYWSNEFVGPGFGDDTITVSGNSVTGTSIGGPTYFYYYNGEVYVQSFRADITGLGLVGPGPNTLTIGDLDYIGLGAGVLVIFDDGSGTIDIQIRDGNDLAYYQFAPPLDTTVPQTFNFAPAPADRTADLLIFAASVGPDRPNAIKITVDGTITMLVDLLGSFDGDWWDTLSVPVSIPAGASSLEVQVLSYDDGSGRQPASLNWIGAGLSLPPPPPPGGEGCTPGAWRGGNGDFRWDIASDPDWNPPGGNPFYHDTLFNDYFAPWGSLGGKTMWDLVKQGGGPDPARKAARSLVAAYLNASHGDVDYPLTTAELEALWNDAVAGGTFLDLHLQLDQLNNLGCQFE